MARDKTISDRSGAWNPNSKCVTRYNISQTVLIYFAIFSNVNTVTIFVGKEKAPFLIHENLLTYVSPYFKTALSPDKFREGQQWKVSLPDVKIMTFEHFTYWLYAKRVEISENPKHFFDRRRALFGRISYAIRLFVLADKILVEDLKTDVCTFLIDLVKKTGLPPSYHNVEEAYSNTPPNSPLRRIMIDWHVWCCDPKGWGRTKEWLAENPEFAADLVEAMAPMMRFADLKNPFKTGYGSRYVVEEVVEGGETEMEGVD